MIALDIETVGLLPGETRSRRALVGLDATLREDGSGDPEAAEQRAIWKSHPATFHRSELA